jgi:hypothetical protein
VNEDAVVPVEQIYYLLLKMTFETVDQRQFHVQLYRGGSILAVHSISGLARYMVSGKGLR